MNKKGTISTSNYQALKSLEKKLQSAKGDLNLTENKASQKYLKERIENLKIDLGWTCLECGEYEKGLALYQTLSWKTYGEIKCTGIAWALTEMKQYDEARRILEKGLREFPESCALWTGLGILHDNLGDHFESLKCFEAAIKFDPMKSPGPLYNKALTLMGLGSFTDASRILDHLIEEYQDDPKYLADRGYCALRTGYSHEALQYYEKAMALFSESPDPHTGVCIYAGFCSSYLELGMKKEAMEISLEGLKRFPDQDSALYQNAGAAFYEMGWRKEAMEILKKGVEKFPEDEELKKVLKDIEDDMDDPDKGDKPPILGALLLLALLYKRGRKK
jgi:tetratricopeptide (TPR) repeat protein